MQKFKTLAVPFLSRPEIEPIRWFFAVATTAVLPLALWLVPEFWLWAAFAQTVALAIVLWLPFSKKTANVDQSETDLRHATIAEATREMEQELGDSIGSVSEQTNRTVERLVKLAKNIAEISEASVEIAALGKRSEGSVNEARSTSDSIKSATDGIARETERSAHAASEAVALTKRAGDVVNRMHAATESIGGVTKLISDIAKKTNLLALNATIEAARAGAAGKGFAVVANDVKGLATQTADATQKIGDQLSAINDCVGETTKAIGDVFGAMDNIDEAVHAVGQAVLAQREAASLIDRQSMAALEASQILVGRINDVSTASHDAADLSHEVSANAEETHRLVANMGDGLLLAMRRTSAAERRMSPRVPCEVEVRLTLDDGQVIQSWTRDMSIGGASVALNGAAKPRPQRLRLEIAGGKPIETTLLFCSAFAMHLQFVEIDDEQSNHVVKILDSINQDDALFIDKVKSSARALESKLEDAIKTDRITEEQLFDTDYRLIAGSDPKQFLTGYTEITDELFPAVQEEVLEFSPRVVFSAAMDRNAYLPTHNKKFSHPQKSDDPVWNAANCRNRRKFDDRAGISAARTKTDHLMQTYDRDMGGGKIVTLKEVDAPINVAGRHWGCLRLAYRLR